MSFLLKIVFFFSLSLCYSSVQSLPEQGKWDFQMSKSNDYVSVPKSLFTGARIIVQITCESKKDVTVKIFWTLQQFICWEDYYDDQRNNFGAPLIDYRQQNDSAPNPLEVSEVQQAQCNDGNHIILQELRFAKSQQRRNEAEIPETKKDNSIFTITKDGVYVFGLHIESITPDTDYNASVHLEIKSLYGYLSAADYPLLPFYGAMCIVYIILGVIWLTVSSVQWRDLLRIQFWIGGVIFLGMLEKAAFYLEYQTINAQGFSNKTAVLMAEFISCSKRTLARMLVIIVSLGFGIVKPRLGPTLHRVVGVGLLYNFLAYIESYLRVMQSKNDPNNKILIASIPLAVLDSGICWWIFTSLVQTTRTLRLRRNTVKLQLYRHFTNTLIFAVIASVIFMLYSIKVHRLADCLKDWKDLWIDEAFWHILFSALLLVIMVLWRPTNNNQRYAFTPLLDNPEDEDDDDEEEYFVSDAYGVKMRSNKSNSVSSNHKSNNKSQTNEEDDLRWVEENIPLSIQDAALPVLDSDEEIINTKFEVSKMQ